MQYQKLGRHGPIVSRIGLGGFSFGGASQWMLSDRESAGVLRRAIELGINFIDTADTYSNGDSETLIGKTWRDLAPRSKLVLATKTGGKTPSKPREGSLSRANLLQAVDASLRRLQTDHIDLFQLHQLDPITPWEETLQTLDELIKIGKVLFIGASNVLAFQLMKMLSICDMNGWSRFTSVQNHYNLAYREEEREMAPLCTMEGLGMVPWSPLARGFLAGTVLQPGSPTTARSSVDVRIAEYFGEAHDFAVLTRVRECADRLQLKPAQVALAWLLAKPGVTAPVIGVTKLNHLEDAVAASSIQLSDDDIRLLEEPYQPHRVYLHL